MLKLGSPIVILPTIAVIFYVLDSAVRFGVVHRSDSAVQILCLSSFIIGGLLGTVLERLRLAKPMGNDVNSNTAAIEPNPSALRTDGATLELADLPEAKKDLQGQVDPYQHVQQLNQELEQRVQQRTLALQESEEKFRQLAENISHVFCLENTDGQVLYTSPSYEAMWGRSIAELYQHPMVWLESVHPEDYDRVVAQLASLQTHREGEMEYRIIRPNGDIRWIYDRSFPIRDAQGEIYRIAGLAEDITDRKTTEAALQMASQNLRTVFNNVSSLLFVHDVNGVLLDINDRALERYGLEREQALQLTLLGDYSAADNPFHLAQAYWARALSGESVRFEWKAKEIKNGGVFDVDITLKRIVWNDQLVILATVLDISERKRSEAEHQQAELALRQSEARFQHLAANIPGIFYQSLIRADGSRQFHYVSSGFLRLFELEPAQLLEDANIFWAMVHPDDVEPLRAEVAHTLLTQQPFQFEYRIIPPSGCIKWIHNAASRQYLANGDIISDGVVLDITERKRSEDERKQAELAQRQSEARFQHMAANIPGVLYQSLKNADGSSNQLIYISPACRQVYEIEPETIQSNPSLFWNLVVPEDQEPLRQAVDQSIKTLEPFNHEYRIRPPSGCLKWIQTCSHPEQQANGDVVWNGVSFDVTDRKQAEDEIRRSKDLFEAMFEESADAIFLVDNTTRLSLTCNQRAVELFEAENREALTGIHGPTLLHKNPFTTDDLIALRTSLATQGTWQGEVEYLTYKGNIFWGSTACKQIQVGNESMLLTRVTDISTQKQAEAALQISEQNLRTIFNNVSSHILIHDIDGTLLDVNNRVLTFYGLERDQMLQLSLIENFSPPDAPIHHIQAYWARTLAGETVHFAWQGKKPVDGTFYELELTLNRIVWNGKAVILASAQDVTDRKQAELALRQSEARLKLALEGSPTVVWEVDLATDRLFSLSSRTGQLVSSEMPRLEHREKLVHPDDREAVDRSYFAALANRSSFQLEHRLRSETSPSEWHWVQVNGTVHVDEAGNPTRAVGISFDIDARKQAELRQQQQAEADQLLATIAQTINQSVRLDQVLETCLEKIRQFLRCDRVLICRFDVDYNIIIEREALSRPVLSLLQQTIKDPCFSQGWAERYRQGYVTTCTNAQAPELTPCYAALLAQMQVQASVVVGILQGDQIWGLMIVHDCDAPHAWQQFEIDLLKQLGLQIGTASQKASLYTQLENQLTQKEVLLKEVNHRVKNNLQMISAMLWLQSEAANNPIVSGALFNTRNRLQAMSLIHEILYQSSDLGQINFDDYIQRLANNILIACSTSPDQIKLSFRLQPVTLNLETAISCGLLLNELITNAIKHGFPDGRSGKIYISLKQAVQLESTAQISAKATATAFSSHSSPTVSHYTLMVQDNGVGIPKELNLNKLQSLGLKIAYDLARQLDGSIEYEHKHGTRFRLLFPVVAHH